MLGVRRRYGQVHREIEVEPVTIYWLMAAVLLALLPHLFRVPWFVAGLSLLSLGWRLGCSIREWPLPSGPFRFSLVAAGITGVVIEYGAIYGKVAGSSLLACLLALKLLETRSVRDVEFTVFLTYFVVTTNFFFDQSIPTALLMMISVILITSTLISAHDRQRPAIDRHKLKTVGGLVLQGLPLMLVLFFLFPRAAGPLWSWPRDDTLGQSGLSEVMAPGSISRMLLSEEVAFRVDFEGPVPPEDELYWRALVLGRFDGRAWTSLEHEMSARNHWIALTDDPIDYAVTMEPHNQRWMFGLDLPDPLAVPNNATLTADFRLVSKKKITQRQRYEMRSHRTYLAQSQHDDLPGFVRRQNLALPDHIAPKARDLAAQWRSTSATDRDLVNEALTYYRQQPFHYTLLPERLGEDPVDDFLFRTREGYCEHYASSFVVLMRAAGIPARVVTGYLGGEINPLGQYMIVLQANAHAWSEVWLEGEGWVRIDPTAAVAPSRVNDGVASALGDQVELPSLLSRNEDSWIRQLTFIWDAVNNGWNQFVLGYGMKQQYKLLEWFGVLNAHRIALVALMILAVLIVLLGIALWMLFHQPKPAHPALAAYLRFQKRLERHGLKRESCEAPIAFEKRASARFPDAAAHIKDVTTLFLNTYYKDSEDDAALQRLKRLVRQSVTLTPP